MGKTNAAPNGARAALRGIGLILSLAAPLLLASCETVNEGAADYRKAVINSHSGDGAPTKIWRKYTLTGPLAPKTEPKASDDPNGAGDVPITKGEKFYVSLLQAYVGPDANFRGPLGFGGTEEIVLVLRVRDSNNFDNPGRFVFYSDDVQRGQFLNFSNLLTLGPQDYAGGVITIDVDEVRLVGSTSHIKDMLNDLAGRAEDEYGPDPEKRQTFHSYARNVFNIIDSDSHGTRYTLTLMPAGGVTGLPYPRFEAGNYVLMRHETRDDKFDWNSLLLDNNTGRLTTTVAPLTFDVNEKGDRTTLLNPSDHSPYEYRENSYVTVQINALRNIPTGKTDPQEIIPPASDPLVLPKPRPDETQSKLHQRPSEPHHGKPHLRGHRHRGHHH